MSKTYAELAAMGLCRVTPDAMAELNAIINQKVAASRWAGTADDPVPGDEFNTIMDAAVAEFNARRVSEAQAERGNQA